MPSNKLTIRILLGGIILGIKTLYALIVIAVAGLDTGCFGDGKGVFRLKTLFS